MMSTLRVSIEFVASLAAAGSPLRLGLPSAWVAKVRVRLAVTALLDLTRGRTTRFADTNSASRRISGSLVLLPNGTDIFDSKAGSHIPGLGKGPPEPVSGSLSLVSISRFWAGVHPEHPIKIIKMISITQSNVVGAVQGEVFALSSALSLHQALEFHQ
jgi:hypothetical protein